MATVQKEALCHPFDSLYSPFDSPPVCTFEILLKQLKTEHWPRLTVQALSIRVLVATVQKEALYYRVTLHPDPSTPNPQPATLHPKP